MSMVVKIRNLLSWPFSQSSRHPQNSVWSA